MRRSVVATTLPVWLPNAMGDRPYPGGGTWALSGVPLAQAVAACGLNSALLFKKPSLAPAALVALRNVRDCQPLQGCINFPSLTHQKHMLLHGVSRPEQSEHTSLQLNTLQQKPSDPQGGARLEALGRHQHEMIHMPCKKMQAFMLRAHCWLVHLTNKGLGFCPGNRLDQGVKGSQQRVAVLQVSPQLSELLDTVAGP